MRLLIVKTSSMGDVVHALPALSDMHRAVPGIESDQRGVHPLQLVFLVRRCARHAAIGNDQMAFAVEQQLVRLSLIHISEPTRPY